MYEVYCVNPLRALLGKRCMIEIYGKHFLCLYCTHIFKVVMAPFPDVIFSSGIYTDVYNFIKKTFLFQINVAVTCGPSHG